MDLENSVSVVVVLVGMALFASVVGVAVTTLLHLPNRLGRPARKARPRR
jgi:hypothetical protein